MFIFMKLIIRKEILNNASKYSGKPFIVITPDEERGDQLDTNQVIEKIKSANLKNICFIGRLLDNNEFVTLIKGLSKIGYFIVLITDGTDDISPIRIEKNVHIVAKVFIPTEERNTISPVLLSLLKGSDEVIFSFEKVEDLNTVVGILNKKTATLPQIVFSTEHIPDEESVTKVYEIYTEVYSKIPFNTRLSLYN